jgi:hypothetical protein
MRDASETTGIDLGALSLRQRLAVYSATVGAIAAGAGAAQGEVIYTNLGAGVSTGMNGSVPIDFNGDSIPEFSIEHTGPVSGDFEPKYYLDLHDESGGINQQHVHEVYGLATLPPGTTVGPSLAPPYSWVTASPDEMSKSKNVLGQKVKGPFDGTPDYVGLRWKFSPSDPDFYYGWALVGTDSAEATGILYGYAYEDQIGQPIQTPEPTSLAALAAGATLSLRRRRVAQV